MVVRLTVVRENLTHPVRCKDIVCKSLIITDRLVEKGEPQGNPDDYDNPQVNQELPVFSDLPQAGMELIEILLDP